jgi:hypothetical protein
MQINNKKAGIATAHEKTKELKQLLATQDSPITAKVTEVEEILDRLRTENCVKAKKHSFK